MDAQPGSRASSFRRDLPAAKRPLDDGKSRSVKIQLSPISLASVIEFSWPSDVQGRLLTPDLRHDLVNDGPVIINRVRLPVAMNQTLDLPVVITMATFQGNQVADDAMTVASLFAAAGIPTISPTAEHEAPEDMLPDPAEDSSRRELLAIAYGGESPLFYWERLQVIRDGVLGAVTLPQQWVSPGYNSHDVVRQARPHSVETLLEGLRSIPKEVLNMVERRVSLSDIAYCEPEPAEDTPRPMLIVSGALAGHSENRPAILTQHGRTDEDVYELVQKLRRGPQARYVILDHGWRPFSVQPIPMRTFAENAITACERASWHAWGVSI